MRSDIKLKQMALLTLPTLLLASLPYLLSKRPSTHVSTQPPTISQVCNDIQIGTDVKDAWVALGRPQEQVNYDYGEFLEVRYQLKETLLQIIYTSSNQITELNVQKNGTWVSINKSGACN